MKIACFKYVGLASGGTEKYLQTLACLLATKHEVDYYYTNNATLIGSGFNHPDNSEQRKKFVESKGIRTVPIHVEAVDTINKTWINTNIWDVFDPSKYDIVQSARYGFTEFPFPQIKGAKIIDSIHGDKADNVSSVEASILLCKWQADMWIRDGGNASRMHIIPSLVYVPNQYDKTTRQRFGVPHDAFVYGIHQRDDDGIFSPVALMAYSKIETPNTYFFVLGASKKYKEMAQQLNLKNVCFISFSPDPKDIHDFLDSLDVYVHARSDGEVCSASIIEAMYHGLPIVTHTAQNMGHAEQIDGCGFMATSVEEYYQEMIRLKNDKSYREEKKINTLNRYSEKYCYKVIEKKILNLYESIL
jgi:glycosyltransferase involved in cell wall biosynthesis